MHRFVLPSDYRELIGVIEQCEKGVELYTKEGFHLNLKSKLCQYVAYTSIFNSKKIRECEIITHCERDAGRLLQYFLCRKGD